MPRMRSGGRMVLGKPIQRWGKSQLHRRYWIKAIRSNEALTYIEAGTDPLMKPTNWDDMLGRGNASYYSAGREGHFSLSTWGWTRDTRTQNEIPVFADPVDKVRYTWCILDRNTGFLWVVELHRKRCCKEPLGNQTRKGVLSPRWVWW